MSALELLLVLAGSFAIHELGHAVAAIVSGAELRGLVVRWYGAGLRVDVAPEQIWKVASGGLIATALLATAIALAAPTELGLEALMLNALLLIVNALPIPGSDGWHIARGLAAR